MRSIRDGREGQACDRKEREPELTDRASEMPPLHPGQD